MQNKIIAAFQSGEKTLGTFSELASAIAVECIGLSGMDYAIIDSEHGACTPESALDYIRTAKLYGLSPFVRVEGISRPAILKMLDAGAEALIIPCVNSLGDAKHIVEYGKYSPIGNRGVSASAGTAFWADGRLDHGIANYFTDSNQNVLLLPQCETLPCLESIEEIAALPGIDGIYVGPFDLTTAMVSQATLKTNSSSRRCTAFFPPVTMPESPPLFLQPYRSSRVRISLWALTALPSALIRDR